MSDYISFSLKKDEENLMKMKQGQNLKLICKTKGFHLPAIHKRFICRCVYWRPNFILSIMNRYPPELSGFLDISPLLCPEDEVT